MSMKTWKVMFCRTVEEYCNVEVEAVDEDTAEEIATEIFFDSDKDSFDVWTDELWLDVGPTEEVQSEPPEQESHLQIVRTGT
jgi:hypothetical protein